MEYSVAEWCISMIDWRFVSKFNTMAPSHTNGSMMIATGTHTEARYSLMTYGVPTTIFPITYQGDVKNNHHLKWIQRRQIKEEELVSQQEEDPNCTSTTDFAGTDLPAREDVLLQRGRIFQEHPGNVYMHQLIHSFQQDGEWRSPKKTPEVAEIIVNEVYTVRRGRFLERDAHGWWSPVTGKEAIRRVVRSIQTARTSTKSPAITKNLPPAVPAALPTKERTYSFATDYLCGSRGHKRIRLFNDVDD